MPLELGYLLNGRYRIDRVLGQGGMGAVYLAHDETLGLECAVKENLNPSPDAERQFRREATLLASLRHHNLPRVTDHFVIGDQQYLVMDFVPGEDLKERLARQGTLDEVDVLLWAAQICDALTYLHNLNPPVVHRDIKPANIKLTEGDEHVMLVDFGIAKAAATGSKTTTSAVALTPGFAPPEQYGMGRTDPRTDQYALAATLYTLLVGQTPPDSMERLLGNARLVPPRELRPDLTEEVTDALVRALELKPDDRFGSVADFKAALFAQLTGKTKPVAEVLAAKPDAAQATQLAAQKTAVARGAAETVAAPPTAPAAKPKPSGLPGWVLPVGVGGAIVVVGFVALSLAGVIGIAGFSVLRATDTPTPSATHSPAPTALLPSLTPTPAPSDTPTPEPPTATLTPLPLPTDTPTPEPPTATPTVAGTPIGGGGRIAFISNRDGPYEIYTMNADGSDVRRITTDGVNKYDPRWTFNGTQLAWSPDGTKLLYVAQADEANGLDIFVINADGSNPIDLTAVEAGRPAGDDYHPTWCADGTIAFTSLRTGGVPQIFTMTLDDPRPRNNSALRNSPREYDPSFYPDCKRIIFVTTVNGTPELWRYFFDGTSYRVFRSDIPLNASAEDPAISPDAKYVAYTRRASDGTDIILASMENRLSNLQLTSTRNNAAPAWGPDGTYLVFVSKRDGNPEIYRMLAGGQEQINLTGNGAVDTDPVWQPLPPP
jgi:Tol biopolymer transport system component